MKPRAYFHLIDKILNISVLESKHIQEFKVKKNSKKVLTRSCNCCNVTQVAYRIWRNEMPDHAKPVLTEWETKLMHIIWERGSATADDIREALRDEGLKRSDSAIRKTLRVMEKKGALTHSVLNRAYVYKPKLKQEKMKNDMIKYVSALLFQGSVGHMALHALDVAELNPEVIQEMRKKLDDAE